MDKPIVYVSQHNHFDPVWHRCWDRSYDFRGKRYRSYADVEELVFDIWLESAKRGTSFVEGQSAVFRKYLDRNPDRLDEIQQLVDDGQIEFMAGGETVSDTNIPSGETLLRNLILGQAYFAETFGIIPTIGTLEDAFGHCAQMPQMFRGIGCKMIHAICRVRVPGDYWKGLDGSVVFIGGMPGRHAGHCSKIPPCPECGGMGCEACDFRGLAHEAEITDDAIMEALRAGFQPGLTSIMNIGGEEAVPNPRLPELIDQAALNLGLDLRHGYIAPSAECLATAWDAADSPTLQVSDEVESNPVFTGCYVTRIKLKQEMRRVENLVNTAERWAAIASLRGGDYPGEELLDAWRNTVFVGFHDAITGTHMDQPYHELLDMLEEAEDLAESVTDTSLEEIEADIVSYQDQQYLAVYNSDSWERSDPVTVTLGDTRGLPTLVDHTGTAIEVLDVAATGTDVDLTFRVPTPGLGYTLVKVIPDSEPLNSGGIFTGPGQIENEFFVITVSDRGIESIYDKHLARQVMDSSTYLPNELILEEDIGDPWQTTQAPSFAEPLSRYTTGVKIRKAANVSEITLTGQHKGTDAGTQILTWRQSVTLYKGYDRIDFRTSIDWDTRQRRLRLAFPTTIKTDEAMYAIPYGAVKRSKYDPNFAPEGKCGDWPAINWVDVRSESENYGVALINTGTPSHKVENGVILMSILRSPTDGWVLDEPEYYSCPDFDGARDAGHHEFYYSLIPHSGDFRAAGIEKRGREVNNPLICRGIVGHAQGNLPSTHSFVRLAATDNVIVTAMKKADVDDATILRLAETAGLRGEADIKVDGAGSMSTVDFLEQDAKPFSGRIAVEPWKIMTVRIEE